MGNSNGRIRFSLSFNHYFVNIASNLIEPIEESDFMKLREFVRF